MAINQGFLKADRTTAGDECYTPFYAVEPLLEFLPKDKIIWCGFDEKWSAFPQLLIEKGFNVVRSSIAEGQDFFEYEPKNWDIFVSNPPFSKKDLVLKRLYELNKPFAVLLPVNSIQSLTRVKMFKEYGLELLTFGGRINYHTNNNFKTITKGNHFGSAYFCNKLLPEKLIFKDLNFFERPLIN